jgi:hypothetical protein
MSVIKLANTLNMRGIHHIMGGTHMSALIHADIVCIADPWGHITNLKEFYADRQSVDPTSMTVYAVIAEREGGVGYRGPYQPYGAIKLSSLADFEMILQRIAWRERLWTRRLGGVLPPEHHVYVFYYMHVDSTLLDY